jgi:DNA helicase-2/ATP-dependent DNA helicase PcrA
MDALIMTRARYRRRYGNDMPESSVPSRFLEEIPPHLLEDLTRGQRASSGGGYGGRYRSSRGGSSDGWDSAGHYSYEDEDQSARAVNRSGSASNRQHASSPQAGSLDNIAQFFSSRKVGGSRPKLEIPVPGGATGFRSGQRVRHPKYGEGVVFRREGDGDDAKITVQFAEFGVKKLVEKFAQLEKV